MSAKAPFGCTGHESTRTIFGAAALASVSQSEADATLEVLLEHGVNHIDTAASYGDSLPPKVLDAASRFTARPPDDAMDELVSRRKLVGLFS